MKRYTRRAKHPCSGSWIIFAVGGREYYTIFAAKYRINGREGIPEKKVDTEAP